MDKSTPAKLEHCPHAEGDFPLPAVLTIDIFAALQVYSKALES